MFGARFLQSLSTSALLLGVCALATVNCAWAQSAATGSEKRLPMIPNVPTFIEAGYPEMTTSVWFGLLAPAATPADIVTRINADVARSIATPEVRKRLIDNGQEPGGGSAEDFGRFIRSEITKYAKVVKAAGIRGE